jgi:hypothetical protein
MPALSPKLWKIGSTLSTWPAGLKLMRVASWLAWAA